MCDPMAQDCPVEDPTGPSFGDMKTMDQHNVDDLDILQANLTMVGALLTATLAFGYNQFVSSNVTDYTTLMSNYKTQTSNNEYWNYANMTKGYGLLAIYGIAFVSQALATFGIAVEINTMVREWGVMALGTGVGLIYSLLLAAAYNTCKTTWSASTNASGEISNIMNQLEWDYGGYIAIVAMVWAAYAQNLNVWTHLEHMKEKEEMVAESSSETSVVMI